MKKIYSSTSQIDMNLLEGQLKADGIEATVRYPKAGAYLNVVGGDLGYDKELWVSDEDYDKAMVIVKEFEDNSKAETCEDDAEWEELASSDGEQLKRIFARIVLVIAVIIILSGVVLELIY